MSKEEKIKLVHDNKNLGDLMLDKEHAQRLLTMSNNGGWKLPKDSLYKLGKDGIINKSSKRVNKAATE